MSAIANVKQIDLARINGASAFMNSKAINSKVINSGVRHTEVLIIGAGLAGLSTALALPKSLNITILSKAELQACSSHYAQGGIAASLDKADSVKDHVADTLVAGAGLCATDNTTSILNAGQQAVQWLCEQGVPFTPVTQITEQNNSTPYLKPNLTTHDLHLTKEGGHSCRRVAHADDATGRHIMEALTLQAQAASNITILPFHEALRVLTAVATDHHLINNDADKNNRCQGAIVFDHHNQRQLTIYSKAVVMASGGLGQLFARASAPDVCVGDGVMMAWQAGCQLANLEFVQFHPTGLALGESSFLISEALRGEGGRLYCPLTRKRFMLAVDERAELAPRDIVARAITEQISGNNLGYVHLDVSHLPASFLREHFPQIYNTLLELGVDITTDPIPVAPTAHYSCGGIVTCANGLSDIKGLYAAGEVAYTGLHGANRLASNSLLECIVVGRNIAKHVPNYLADDIWTTPTVTNTQSVSLPEDKLGHRAFGLTALKSKSTLSASAGCKDIDIYSYTDTDTDIKIIAASLKSLMTSHMGIVRNAESLKQALSQLQQWQQTLELLRINDKPLSPFRLARQLQLATLIVHSALQRHESRGGHYRQDYPALASLPLVSIIKPKLNNEIVSLKTANSFIYSNSLEKNPANSDSLQTLAPV